ncbi:peptidase domain-containing ABC transporter [Bacillus sp. FSL H8-0547]
MAKHKRRVPYIEQMQQTECGICCMAMISSYYRSSVSLYELREFLGSGRDGTTLFQLVQLAKHLGMDASCYKVKAEELVALPLPAILFWDDQHYVVLEKVTGKNAVIIDPAIGRRKLSFGQFAESFSGYVLVCKPNDGFVIQKQPSVWKPYIRMLSGRKRLLMPVILLSLMIQSFSILMPVLIQFLIDQILLKNNASMLSVFFAGMVFLVCFQGLFSFFRGRVLIALYNHLDKSMMTRFFSHLLKLPYSFFQLRSFGDLLFRSNSHRIIRDLLANQLIKGVLDAGLLLVMIGYMFSKSVLLTVCVLALMSVNIGVMLISKQKLSEYNQEEIVKNSALQGYQSEIFYGMFTVKTAGIESKTYKDWQSKFEELITAYRKKELLLNGVNTASGMIIMLAPLTVLLIGSGLILNGTFTIGALVAFHALASQLFMLSGSLVQTGNSFILTDSYLRRIQDVLDAPPEYESRSPKAAGGLTGEVELKNVSYSYSKYSPEVIRDVSLTIRAGQKIAIVGKSGAGKSTLARLLLGLYEPVQGNILFDGVDLKDWDKPRLRSQIGVVPQDVTLFNRSIYNNITVHRHNASMEEVEEAAKMAQIHQDIMTMPMKYHTMISEMGMNISGGQRQRIALARALLHKPSILVLDEATSSLDQLNEARIDQYLTNMKCTRIVIAHRLSTIQNADRIFVMHDGTIAEQGTHDELMNMDGHYASFYQNNREQKTIEVVNW